MPETMGGNPALDTFPYRFLKSKVCPHTISHLMMGKEERKGPDFNVNDPIQLEPCPSSNHLKASVSLCQQKSFLQV